MTKPPVDRLETELRAGVPHYVTGQHQAWSPIEEPNLALLLYANVMGWAVLIPCELQDGSWRHCGVAQTVSVNGPASGWQPLTDTFELSDRMLVALRHAELVDEPYPGMENGR